VDAELDFAEPVKVKSRKLSPISPEAFSLPETEPVVTTIWFDPGGETGWAVMSIWKEAMEEPDLKILDNLAGWSAGQFEGPEELQAGSMMSLVEAWDDDTLVGYEDFILRKFSMGRELLAPVRLSARFEDRMFLAGRKGQLVPPQSSSLGLKSVTDDRLRRWGFWNPLSGKEHARNALSHAITYLRRHKEAHLANTRSETD